MQDYKAASHRREEKKNVARNLEDGEKLEEGAQEQRCIARCILNRD